MRVLIVEDHPILSESLATALRVAGIDEVQVHGDDLGADAVSEVADGFRATVVLLDLHLGDDRLGIPLIGPLAERGIAVLMLTASTDRILLAQCLEAGAAGLFNKAQPFDSLVALVRDAAVGRTVLQPAARQELLAELREERRNSKEAFAPFATLTPRESDVLEALLAGRSADEIAHQEVVSVATVRSHIQAVLRKLGVNSQLAAVALAHRAGWPGSESS